MKNLNYDYPVGVFDDLMQTLNPDEPFFIEKPERLGRWVTYEQEAFIKFMVEDSDFLFQVYVLLDQNWFDVPEMRDIARTIKDMYRSGALITYDSVLEKIAQRYGSPDESKTISLEMIKTILEECQGNECLEDKGEEWYKRYFVKRLLLLIPIPEKEWN